MKKLLGNRILRQGGAATLITIFAVVLAVLLNMIVNTLAGRFGLSLDLTTGGVFTLSDETREFMASVDKPVSITVFSPEDDLNNAPNPYYQQSVEMMNGIADANANITIQYVDIIANPGYTAQYPDLNLASNNILVECEGRTHVMSMNDFFNTQVDPNTYQTYITSSKAEQAMATAILNVTDDDPVQAVVLGGHNEVVIADFVRTLEMNGYQVTEQDLESADTLNPEASVLIMAAPARDISEEAAARLDAFLNNNGRLGKNLFYLAGASQPEDMPILNAFLADWGIAVQPGIVYETSSGSLFMNNVFSTLIGYAEDEYSADVVAKSLPFAMPKSRPVAALFESKGYATVSTLLEFSAGSGVVPIDAGEEFFENAEASGPHGGLVLSKRLNYDGTTPLTSHVLVAGSYLAVDPSLIGSVNFANSEYLVNLLNRLAGREQSFSVQNKTIETVQLGITLGQADAIGLVFTVAIPLLVLVTGIVIWLRRRHR